MPEGCLAYFATPLPALSSPELALELGGNPDYDVMSDDWSFVVTEPLAADTGRFIRVVHNWHEQFRDRQQD